MTRISATTVAALLVAYASPGSAQGNKLSDVADQLRMGLAGEPVTVTQQGPATLTTVTLQGPVTLTSSADAMFPSAGWELRPGAPVLGKIIPVLSKLRNTKIVVGGYTDNAAVGSQLQSMGVSNNLDLSCKRAASVVAYLASQGVNRNLLSAQCFGETHPVAPNDTSEGRAQNRRVSITLTGDGAFAAPDNAVIRANAAAGVAAIQACMAPLTNPFHESRAYAMMHLAIHDALNAIDRKYQPYAYNTKAEPGTSADAAVAAAAYHVMSPTIQKLPAEVLPNEGCVKNGNAVVEAAYVLALAVIPDGPGKTQGIALGKAAAAAVLAKRASDRADDGGPYINKTCPPAGPPGAYQCTPERPFVAFEKWANITPFVMQDTAQFRPVPPYKVDDAKFKADLEEVKKIGGDGKTTPSTRTPDQSEIALFWLESSPLKWSRIGRTVAADKGLDMWESARLFAILEMALTDGYIAMSASKNHYQFWRPVTAIRASGDASWTPFQITPPGPDYPSGHSIEGGVGAEVLKQLIGTDQFSFKDCGATLPAGSTCYDEKPVLRSYTSFTQAADENAISRVYVGFHFRTATAEGTAYGRKIGERAATLLPATK